MKSGMERIMTKTMGEICLQQGYLQEALEIFTYLAEKDPQDMAIQKRVQELREKLHQLSLLHPLSSTREDKIRPLEKWLENIRKRRKN
jgi:hypothetical protein